MIRQARVLARPASRAFSQPHTLQTPSSLTRMNSLSPSRSLTTQPQRCKPSPTTTSSHVSPRRNFHYNPQPMYHTPPPRKPFLKVLRDMALGSLLTIALSTAYDYYDERQYMSKLASDEAWAEDLRVQLAAEFDAARQTPLDDSAASGMGDFERQAKLRELTFNLPLRVVGRDKAEEAGWLPGFPLGDELYGKERVPAEETKMYVGRDEYGGISSVYVAANVDVDQKPARLEGGEAVGDGNGGYEEDQSGRGGEGAAGSDIRKAFANAFAAATDSGPDERRVSPREWEDASGTVLGELVARVRLQKDAWKRQGRLSEVEEDFLLVVLYLRNRTWMFLLDRNEVQPLSGVTNILK